jgi:TetR/AcrR family transcriptional regulator, cholesterol catabolism regulator
MNRRSERPVTERLFDTAADLFWHKGYAATTTREIATAVGIQQASLYHHMASKEDLVYKICLSSLEQFLLDVPAAVNAAPGPLDRVRILIREHLATLLRHQKRNVTLLTEFRSLSAPHRREVTALRDEYEAFVRSTLENAQTAGTVRDDIPAKYLSLALMSVLNHAALWFRRHQVLIEDQLADIFAKVFLEGSATRAVRASLALPELKAEIEKPATRVRKKPNAAQNERASALARALDAAVGLFSQKGYTATSTREVAALLGMQKASLYYHIDSKEELLYLVCRSSLEQIRQDVETAVHGVEGPLDRQRTLISSHIESLLQDAERHSTTFTEMHALSEDRLTQVLALRDQHENLVRAILQEGQSAGVLRRDIDAKYLCLALLGLMNRVTVWYRRGGPLSPSQVGQLLGVIFLTGAAV